MVALADEALQQIPLPQVQKQGSFFADVPAIDLSNPNSEAQLVEACERLGFFKVTNHGVPSDLMANLEGAALEFFSRPQAEKELASSSGYGSRRIGSNGDVGWLEYLLLGVTSNPTSPTYPRDVSATTLRSAALDEYTVAVRSLACRVLEMMARGLGIGQSDTLSKLVMDEDSDCALRLNHYPPCPVLPEPDSSLTGFGAHTDPQIISVLRSNSTSGLEIELNGRWVSVPSDQNSFFVNVGDSLQVLTNGRFRSVKHRVLANGLRPRLSMIFFGGPPSTGRLAPLPLLIGEGEQSLYREFTWCEYKRSAWKTRLADNRLEPFERKGVVSC